MKRIFSVILVILLIYISEIIAFALTPGSCTQSAKNYQNSGMRTITLVCSGSPDDGAIPNIAISTANTALITGYRLEQVEAYPTVGGTAPDAADVFILTDTGIDLLGSVDGSTTAYMGLNLIHATLTKRAYPDIYLTGSTSHAHYSPMITGVLTLKVLNQATASANYTIVLTFQKQTENN